MHNFEVIKNLCTFSHINFKKKAMKKIYKLITLCSIALFAVNANAVTINVTVGGTGNVFSPNTFTANIGDVVLWTWAGGTHNVTSNSSSVPAGAAVFVSPTQTSGTFSYTITTAGSYGYACTIHALSGMTGTFTVSAVGILDPAVDLLVTAYPNPFSEKITLKYGKQIDAVKIFNIVGEEVKSVELIATEDKKEIYFEGIPSGVYFMRTYNEGTVVETKKIVKAK